jgi:hypothetical protein
MAGEHLCETFSNNSDEKEVRTKIRKMKIDYQITEDY